MERQELKEKIIHGYEYRHEHECNYVFSENRTFVCFVRGEEPYECYFCVADNDFNPLFVQEFSAYVNTCGISSSGRYAVAQTANTPTDQARTMLFDVEAGSLLWSVYAPFNWKSISGYTISDEVGLIVEHHEGYDVHYDFSGVVLNVEDLEANRYTHPDVTPYELNAIAQKYIHDVSRDGYDERAFSTALNSIKKAESFPNMSTYQLSQTSQMLGELYEKICDYDKALEAYQKALELNPKAPVKKKIKELEKICS